MLTIIAGMPRSGSTWTYQVLTEVLQRRYPDLHGLGFRMPPDPRLLSVSEQHIVKWHDACPFSYVTAPRDRVRVVYSYRDLRNVVYSLANKLLIPVERTIDGLPYLLQMDAFWESAPPALVMRYEDFWQDSWTWVSRLAAQVGHFPAAEIDEIHAKYSFHANRERAVATATELSLDGVPLDDLSRSISHEHGKLLHWNHIREGTGYEWLKAPEAELRRLSMLLTPWLLRNGYEKHADWVDRLLATRAQQGGCDGKEASKTQADGQRERGSADGDPAASSNSGG